MKDRLYHLSLPEREQVLEIVTAALSARKEVRFAYAHGSILSQRPVHDLDLALYMAAESTKDQPLLAIDLGLELEKLLPLKVRLPVDVRLLNNAPLGFRYHAVRGRLLFERNEDERVKFVVATVTHYLDMKPLLDQALKEALTSWS